MVSRLSAALQVGEQTLWASLSEPLSLLQSSDVTGFYPAGQGWPWQSRAAVLPRWLVAGGEVSLVDVSSGDPQQT